MKRFVVAVLLVSMCSLFVPLPPSRAAADPFWLSDFIIETKAGRTDFLNAHPCTKKDIRFQQKVKVPLPGQGPWKKTAAEQWCGFFNTSGFVTGSRIVADGDMNNGLFIKHTGLTPHYSPSDMTVLTSAYTGSGGGAYQTLSLAEDIFSSAKFIDYTTNSVDTYLAWQINTTNGTLLRYANNTPLRTKAYALSANGDWLVAAVLDRGLLRINTRTLEATPFSLDQRGSNVSETNYHRLSISNDGNKVIFADSNMYTAGRLRGQQAKVYDLRNCTVTAPLSSLSAVGAFDTTGCDSYDLLARIKQNYPSAYAVLDPWLHPTLDRLELRVAHRETGSAVAETLQLTTVDSQAKVKGYLAMGDSFTSGEGELQGGIWYEAGTDEQGDKSTFANRNLCHLSKRSYPYLIAKELELLQGGATVPVTPENDGLFHSVACSGAKIHNIIGGFGEDQGSGDEDDFAERDNQYRFFINPLLGNWQPGTAKQIKSITGEKFDVDRTRVFTPEIITIGIGGNDVGFGKYVEACANAGTCRYAEPGSVGAAEVAIGIAKQRGRLVDTYSEIRKNAPQARVYVHGYPQFIKTTGPCGKNVPFNDQERLFIDQSIQYMNQVIASAAAEAGVVYVDVSDALAGNELCSDVPQNDMAFNGVTAGNDFGGIAGFCFWRSGCLGKESFHPNDRGQRQYSGVIMARTNNLTLPNPAPTASQIPLPAEFFGDLAQTVVERINTKQLHEAVPQLSTLMTSDGEVVEVHYDGLLPGATATLTLFSDPIEIAEVIIGESGSITIPFVLPEGVPPGLHELHLTTTTQYGDPIDVYEHVVVGVSPEDFDGDGVTNTEDSCPMAPNSFIDEDADGIDDACDQVVQPQQEELPPEEEPELPTEEEIDKGVVSEETMAGREERAASEGQVLGASTSVAGANMALQATGSSALGQSVGGSGVVLLVLLMWRSRKHKKYSVR